MAAVRRRLAPDSLFLFSVETSKEADASARGWLLEPLGRYTHATAYIRRCAASADFVVRELTSEPLRDEAGAPVSGLIAVLATP